MLPLDRSCVVLASAKGTQCRTAANFFLSYLETLALELSAEGLQYIGQWNGDIREGSGNPRFRSKDICKMRCLSAREAVLLD